MKGLLVVLAAPSGGGKTTITRALLERRSDLGFSVSATTRPPRPGERNGEAYYFLSRDEFARRRAAGEFLESAEYAGEWYGTLKSEVERIRGGGRHVLLDIEVQGVRQVRRAYPPPASVSIFIVPPSADVLIERLRARSTESEAELARRLAIAAREIAEARKAVVAKRRPVLFDHVVVNDSLERAVEQVSRIIDAPRGVRRRSAELAASLSQLIQEILHEADRLARTGEAKERA